MRDPSILSQLRHSGLAAPIIGPGDEGYDRARRVWNGVWDRFPLAVVRAGSTEDVERVVRFAADTGTLLAVRGGGHSIPGLSTCDGGIVLDLGALDRIEVDPARRLARVGGGALLGDLDRAGAPHGLVVPAGVISHTGAGGLTLGGGMGWLSRRFGLTIDHLVEAEVVTAAGERIVASDRSEPELFWALRGGGGNFGVVTSFTFGMRPLGPVESRSWSWPPERVAEALAALADRTTGLPRTLTVSLNVTREGLSLTVLQTGPEIDAGMWDAFATLAGPGTPGPRHTDFVAFQSRGDGHMPWGRRYYSRGGFLASLSLVAVEAILEVARDLPSPDAEVYLLQLGGAVTDVAEDATAYSGRAAGWYWIVQPIWDDPALDARCIARGRAGAARMAEVSSAGNYVNEQGEAGTDIARQSYGDAKYRRLGTLKARLDPDNLFRLNQNILPGA